METDNDHKFDGALAALTATTEVAQRVMDVIVELRAERDAEIVRLRALGCPAGKIARACRISERQVTTIVRKAVD